MPETVEPAAGRSMLTLGGAAATVTVTVADPTSGAPSVSVANTVIVCVPGERVAVFRE
jgi:hypothetical protein